MERHEQDQQPPIGPSERPPLDAVGTAPTLDAERSVRAPLAKRRIIVYAFPVCSDMRVRSKRKRYTNGSVVRTCLPTRRMLDEVSLFGAYKRLTG
jgi:hypothetical protein